MLIARDDFTVGEKLSFRWCGPSRIVKAMNKYVFQKKDLRSRNNEEGYGAKSKFYSVATLYIKETLTHVISSETGMVVLRLLKIVECRGWKNIIATNFCLEKLMNF